MVFFKIPPNVDNIGSFFVRLRAYSKNRKETISTVQEEKKWKKYKLLYKIIDNHSDYFALIKIFLSYIFYRDVFHLYDIFYVYSVVLTSNLVHVLIWLLLLLLSIIYEDLLHSSADL